MNDWFLGRAGLIKVGLLLVLAAITFSPMLHTGFLTADDAERHLEVLSGGVLGGIWGVAEASGRLSLAFHYFLTHIPYLSDDFVYRKSFLILAHVVTVAYFAYVLGKYLQSKTVTLVFLVLFMVFLTNSLEHNLYASYPFAFHASMMAAIGSAHLLHVYTTTDRRPYLIFSAICYGLAIAAYEQFTVYLLFLVGWLYFTKKPETTQRLKLFVWQSSPFIFVVAIYLLLMVGFKILVPGMYPGTEFAPFNLAAFLVTLKTFILSSLPLYVPFGYTKSISSAILEYRLSLNSLVENFRFIWMIKTFIGAALITWALKCSDYRSDLITLGKQASTILLLLVLSVLLISVSGKYQDWVLNSGVLAYSSSSYTAQLFAAALVALIVCALVTPSLVRKISGFDLFLVATIGLTPVVVITEYHNENLLAMQRNSANKWHAIDSMGASGVLNPIPKGSIIYAPEFMQTGGIASMREGYWNGYLRGKYSIDIDITGDRTRFNRPEYFGKRYLIDYQSKPPHRLYYASLQKEISQGWEVEIPQYEKTGFYHQEIHPNGIPFRWSKKTSSLFLCNRSNEPAVMEFQAKAATDGPRSEPLTVCLLEKCRDYRLSNVPTSINETRSFPPGCSSLAFNASFSPVHAQHDSRQLYFWLSDAKLIKPTHGNHPD